MILNKEREPTAEFEISDILSWLWQQLEGFQFSAQQQTGIKLDFQ
jgi:hypothetical protein